MYMYKYVYMYTLGYYYSRMDAAALPSNPQTKQIWKTNPNYHSVRLPPLTNGMATKGEPLQIK